MTSNNGLGSYSRKDFQSSATDFSQRAGYSVATATTNTTRNIFSNAAMGFGANAATAETKPDNSTLLGSLTKGTGLNFAVNTSSIDQHRLSYASSPNATLSTRVEPSRAAVDNVGGQIAQTKSNISDVIREAQNEVMVAAKMMGHDAAQLYPSSTSTGTVAGLALQAAAPAAAIPVIGSTGAAIATAVSASMDAIGNHVSSTKRAVAESQIRSALTTKQSDPQAEQQFNTAYAGMFPNETAPKAKLNWEAFFKQGNELSQLMALDPDNPNPEIVPEWQTLSQQELKVEEIKLSHTKVEEQKYDAGHTGELTHAINTGNIAAVETMAKNNVSESSVSEIVSSFLPMINKASTTASSMTSFTNSTTFALNILNSSAAPNPALTNEPDLDKLAPKETTAFRPGMV